MHGVTVMEAGKILTAERHGQLLPGAPFKIIQPRGVFPGMFNPVDGAAL